MNRTPIADANLDLHRDGFQGLIDDPAPAAFAPAHALAPIQPAYAFGHLTPRSGAAPVITGADTTAPIAVITLASINTSGVQLIASAPAISADGTEVLFTAGGSGYTQVYLKNLVTGSLTVVSSDSGGTAGDNTSDQPQFSADGTKVVFHSIADNLVAGDTGGHDDVFVKDLSTGAIVRASANAGTGGNSASSAGTFSADGTEVTFESYASNLVSGDTNGHSDIFVTNLTTGAITLVSTDASGNEVNGDSLSPSFSSDGTKILFYSGASNLVSGDTNGVLDVFIKDLTTGAVTRVSTNSSGVQANNQAYDAQFSPDGTKVVFTSSANNLVSGDNNADPDVFVKDLVTGAVTQVSARQDGVEGNNLSDGGVFTPDGTKVIFYSTANNFVSGDTNGGYDVYEKDLVTGVVTLVSQNPAGVVGNLGSDIASVSSDGSKIAFQSGAANLVFGDTGGQQDIFVSQRGYQNGGGAVAVASGIAVSDADSANLTGATVTIASGFTAGDALNFTNANGIGGSYNASTGVLTLSGVAPVASYQAALESITFSSTSNDPTAAGSHTTRSVSWVVNDDTGNASNGATTVFAVTGAAPAVTTSTATADSFAQTAAVLDHAVTVTDIDSATLAAATVSISNNFVSGQDVLAFTNDGATMGNIAASYSSSTGVLTLTSSGDTATVAQWDAALRAVTYEDTSASPNTVVRTVSFTVFDGQHESNVATKTLSVGKIYDLTGGGTANQTGGSGDDGFTFGNTFDSTDTINGGGGSDNQMQVGGTYAGAIVLDPSKVSNIQVMAFQPGNDYTVHTNAGFVGFGNTFTFWSVSMGTGNHVSIDGSAETTGGHFQFYLGQGSDTATGGSGNDVFYGEGGADHLTGGQGADTFAYLSVADSDGTNGNSYDTLDFRAGTDKIQLTGTAVTTINAAVSGALHAASFESDLVAVLGHSAAHELDAGHAVAFTANSGDLSGHVFLVVGTSGAANGYAAGADYVFDVTAGSTTGLATSDFI